MKIKKKRDDKITRVSGFKLYYFTDCHYLFYSSFIRRIKTGKKGLEPLPFGFGNRCSTN